jgi:hypothetical protein
MSLNRRRFKRETVNEKSSHTNQQQIYSAIGRSSARECARSNTTTRSAAARRDQGRTGPSQVRERLHDALPQLNGPLDAVGADSLCELGQIIGGLEDVCYPEGRNPHESEMTVYFDNMPLYSTRTVMRQLQQPNFKKMEYPPDLPYLALCHFFLVT